jgi:hypothetical protein
MSQRTHQSISCYRRHIWALVGELYNDIPDRVRYNRETPFPFEQVAAISLKDPLNKAKLERLQAIARKLSCAEMTIDNADQVRIIVFVGRTTDCGYEFFDRNQRQAPKHGDYLTIPGEEEWYAFRRLSSTVRD